MIHVIATVSLKPGTRAAFLEIFKRVVPKVRAEVGCIEYGPTVDVASGLPPQGPLRPDVVVILEKWESLPALMAHLQQPHMKAYKQETAGLALGVALQVLEPG